MDLQHFLAMTGAEFALCPEKPKNIAWMACHFSPYGTGLSNLPSQLPNGSMLIVNDRIPICGHDADQIANELNEIAGQFSCDSILLDFQRDYCKETATVVDAILRSSPIPVGVSEPYARGLDCPVFVSAPPLNVLPEQHLAPWLGREIWLETALEMLQLTLTEKGCDILPLPYAPRDETVFHDDKLHCAYHIGIDDNAAVFTLWRTKQDIDALLQQAADLGITKAVGLFQQFRP